MTETDITPLCRDPWGAPLARPTTTPSRAPAAEDAESAANYPEHTIKRTGVSEQTVERLMTFDLREFLNSASIIGTVAHDYL
jgi:hypothetical protein